MDKTAVSSFSGRFRLRHTVIISAPAPYCKHFLYIMFLMSGRITFSRPRSAARPLFRQAQSPRGAAGSVRVFARVLLSFSRRLPASGLISVRCARPFAQKRLTLPPAPAIIRAGEAVARWQPDAVNLEQVYSLGIAASLLVTGGGYFFAKKRLTPPPASAIIYTRETVSLPVTGRRSSPESCK